MIRGSPYRPAASEDAVKEGLTEDRIVHTPNGSETSCITGGNDRRLYTKYRQIDSPPVAAAKASFSPSTAYRTENDPASHRKGWARPSPAGPVDRYVLRQKWCRCSRQPDVTDAQWLQRLRSFGLLRASFPPKGQIAELRSYVRKRKRLVEYAASHIKHMHKTLTEMSLQLHHVSPTSPAPPAAPHPRDPCRRARS